jgi:hypothetical protein
MPGAPPQHLDRSDRILLVIGREVDHRVEAPPAQEPPEFRARAVGSDPLDPLAERIGKRAAVQRGYPMAGGQKAKYEQAADEPGSADDENMHARILSWLGDGRKEGASCVPWAAVGAIAVRTRLIGVFTGNRKPVGFDDLWIDIPVRTG